MIVSNSVLIKQSCSGMFQQAHGAHHTSRETHTALLLVDTNQKPITHLSV